MRFSYCEEGVVEEKIPRDMYSELCLSTAELREIALYGKLIEEHFGGIPQDVE
jgi:hypothetical protein